MIGCVIIVLYIEFIVFVGISDWYLKVIVGWKFCCLDLVVYVVIFWLIVIVIFYISCKYIWYLYIKKFVIVENNVIWKFWLDFEIFDFIISIWLYVIVFFFFNE